MIKKLLTGLATFSLLFGFAGAVFGFGQIDTVEIDASPDTINENHDDLATGWFNYNPELDVYEKGINDYTLIENAGTYEILNEADEVVASTTTGFIADDYVDTDDPDTLYSVTEYTDDGGDETSPTSDFEGSASGLINDTVSDLGSTLMTLLRPILMLVAVLIALFFGVKLIRRWIGGSRG